MIFIKIPGKDFEMQISPVTQRYWECFMGNNPSHFKGNDLPVEQVCWNDCQEFIKTLNTKQSEWTYRLPTEEEWEYCCRADGPEEISEKEVFEQAWCYENSENKTHPVEQKKSNAFGLYDMRGNVWEWTESQSGSSRVFRGGGWYDDARSLRSAWRSYNHPSNRSDFLGFRLVRQSRIPSSSNPSSLDPSEAAKRAEALRQIRVIRKKLSQLEDLLK